MTTPSIPKPPAVGTRVKLAGELDALVIPGVGPRGVIPVSLMQAPLRVEIPKWLEPDPTESPHILTLHWIIDGKETVVSHVPIMAPPPPIPDPIVMYVPLGTLREKSGVGEIYYTVKTDSNTTEMEPRLPIRVDMVGPTLLRPQDHLEFVVTPTSGVDEAYITANNPIRLRVPTYNGQEAWDYCELYASNSPTPPVSGSDGTTVFASTADPLIAELDGEKLRRLLNGNAYLFYRVFDEAGNFSTMSASLAFELALTAPPSDLQPPRLRPPVYNDLLIKRDDARLDEGGGVFVRILAYSGWASGDSVVVYWKGRPIQSTPVVRFPCDVEVPWPILRGPAAQLVAEQVSVRYEIMRGTQPPVPSKVARFNVNLTIAGQENPNAPAKLNMLLASVEIRGQNPPTLNLIDDRHRGQDVLASVVLFDKPEAGQVLTLFANGVGPVACYTVKDTDIAGQIVSFSNVPWRVFEGQVNAYFPFHYITDNGVNEQRSPFTEVNVNAPVVITPTLPAPVVQHTRFNDYATCNSTLLNGDKTRIVTGVRWLVKADAIQPNDEVRFKWKGYSNNNWSGPLDGTEFAETIVWTPVHMHEGWMVVVNPYQTTLYPMRNRGSAVASYGVWRNGVNVAASLPGHLRIDLTYAGSGGYCGPDGIVRP